VRSSRWSSDRRERQCKRVPMLEFDRFAEIVNPRIVADVRADRDGDGLVLTWSYRRRRGSVVEIGCSGSERQPSAAIDVCPPMNPQSYDERVGCSDRDAVLSQAGPFPQAQRDAAGQRPTRSRTPTTTTGGCGPMSASRRRRAGDERKGQRHAISNPKTSRLRPGNGEVVLLDFGHGLSSRPQRAGRPRGLPPPPGLLRALRRDRPRKPGGVRAYPADQAGVLSGRWRTWAPEQAWPALTLPEW